MIETRTKQIFDYLTSDYDYHSSEDMGNAMKVSSKSIQKEINILNSIIKNEGAIVESETGKGYKFKIKNDKKFKNFLKKDWYKYAYYQQESGNKDLRIESILKLLLFSNSYIKQQEIADMFFVSTSQVNKDIREVKQLLSIYNISLISKPYYGMKIHGDEKDIRLAIRNEIGEDPSIFGNDDQKEIFNQIQDIIAENESFQNFGMPYANFKNLVVHIYISVLRIRSGKYIELATDLSSKVVYYDEFNLANKVILDLASKLDIKFPKDEILYLAMHLITKNSVTNFETVSADIAELAQEMIDEIYRVSKYDFRSNIELFFALSMHLGPLIERIRYGLPMKNPIIDDIKENQIAYMLATVSTYPINKKYKTQISDDEIGYIALHIASAMENNSHKKRDILVVCGSGNSSAQIMKAQIEKNYKDQLNTLTLTSLGDLCLYNLDNFDFIVSSVKINQLTSTPIVYVDIIFKQRDFDKIENFFNIDGLDEISKIFANSIFLKDIDVKDMKEAMEVLAKEASQRTKLSKDEIIKQFRKREQMAFTSYKNVALPHILEQVDVESFSIVLIPKDKVKWKDDSIDLIYSLFVGKEIGDMSAYYEKLGEFLNNENSINQATKASNKDEFLNIFLGGNKNG